MSIFTLLCSLTPLKLIILPFQIHSSKKKLISLPSLVLRFFPLKIARIIWCFPASLELFLEWLLKNKHSFNSFPAAVFLRKKLMLRTKTPLFMNFALQIRNGRWCMRVFSIQVSADWKSYVKCVMYPHIRIAMEEVIEFPDISFSPHPHQIYINSTVFILFNDYFVVSCAGYSDLRNRKHPIRRKMCISACNLYDWSLNNNRYQLVRKK